MKWFRASVLPVAFVLLIASGSGQPLPVSGGEGDPKSEKPAKVKPLGGDWEVLFADNSTMKLTLLDDQLVVQTPYGALTIPSRDIRKIEFGARLEGEERQQFDAALAGIAAKDAKKREEGKEQLKKMGGKIAPFLKSALRKADAESRPHLEQVYESVAGDRESRKLEPRDHDTITTDESQFAGRVTVSQLRIDTFQFGELKLRVADAKAIQFGGLTGSAIDEKLEIVEAVNNQLLQTHMGKTIGIKVTGAQQGSVWGSGPYTGDSTLAVAAVHAGAVKIGETKVVKVRIVQDPGVYLGTTANGVSTSQYGRFPAGAYEIVVK